MIVIRKIHDFVYITFFGFVKRAKESFQFLEENVQSYVTCVYFYVKHLQIYI